MNYNGTGIHALAAVKASDGLTIQPTFDPTVIGWGVVIPGAGTFYIPFGSEIGGAPSETALLALGAKWSAGLAGVITLEACSMPATLSGNGQGGVDVTEIDTTGPWQPFNPLQAGSLYATATGAGNAMSTALTLTLGGTNVGGAAWNIPDFAHRRGHAKLVASAGGTLRFMAWGKLAA